MTDDPKNNDPSTAPASAPQKIGFARRAVGYGTILFGCGCIFVMDHVDIIMNASQSLDEPSFVMLDHPFWLSHGVVVSATMPSVLQANYGAYQYVKRIGGVPGDEITLDDAGSPCVNGVCYPVWFKDDAPVAPTIAPGIIPPNHYALFGTSPDSLDSRYSIIGLIPEDTLVGRGWALPIKADWREVSE